MSSASSAVVRPRLSVAMIVGQQPVNLAATLQCIGKLADELLIVDVGCGERTLEAARRRGARIVQHAWQDDFSAVRNAGQAAAQGDWVLWLEAGERISSAGVEELRNFVDCQAGRDKAYLLYLEAPPHAPQGAAERVARIRLIPNLPGARFVGRVRETVRASLLAQGLTLELLPITIQQAAHENDPEFKRTRARAELRLLDQDLPERGQQPELLNALGECHAALDNQQAAAQYFRQTLRAAGAGSTEMLEAYYGLLTTFALDQHEERLAVCLEALDRFPFDAQMLCAMGNYLQAQNRMDLSCRAYQSAVQLGQVNPEVWHLCDVGEVAAICLSTTWQFQGQDDKAREVLQEAALRMPHSARVRRAIIDLEVNYGRVLEALGHAEKLPTDFPNREAFRSAIRGGCQAARKNWIPAIGYLETAYDAGCRETLCMRWLAVSLLGAGRHDDAEVIITEWQAMEPDSSEVRQYAAAIRSHRPAEAAASPAEQAAARPNSSADGLQRRIDLPQGAPAANFSQAKSPNPADIQRHG